MSQNLNNLSIWLNFCIMLNITFLLLVYILSTAINVEVKIDLDVCMLRIYALLIVLGGIDKFSTISGMYKISRYAGI